MQAPLPTYHADIVSQARAWQNPSRYVWITTQDVERVCFVLRATTNRTPIFFVNVMAADWADYAGQQTAVLVWTRGPSNRFEQHVLFHALTTDSVIGFHAGPFRELSDRKKPQGLMIIVVSIVTPEQFFEKPSHVRRIYESCLVYTMDLHRNESYHTPEPTQLLEEPDRPRVFDPMSVPYLVDENGVPISPISDAKGQPRPIVSELKPAPPLTLSNAQIGIETPDISGVPSEELSGTQPEHQEQVAARDNAVVPEDAMQDDIVPVYYKPLDLVPDYHPGPRGPEVDGMQRVIGWSREHGPVLLGYARIPEGQDGPSASFFDYAYRRWEEL